MADAGDHEVAKGAGVDAERLRLAVELSSHGIWDWDLQSSALWWSPALFRLLGVDLATFGGTIDEFFTRVHPDDVAHVEGALQAHWDTRAAYEVEFRMRHEEGHDVVVQARGQASWAPGGDVVRMAGVILDMTPAVRARAALRLRERESRELLLHAQKMDALGQLTGGLAHDFNNLLSVVLSALETLGEVQEHLPEDQRAALDDAFQATRRGAALTRSLLGFARRAELDPVVLELEDVIAAMGPLLRRTLPANVALEVHAESGPARVRVDRVGLESALLNLVLNARDALPEGGRVELRLARHRELSPPELAPGDYVELCVEDDGEGMSPETLARVFEPFFTTKVHHGSGMGLAMTHGFAQQSGGRCDVQSRPGKGTRVSLLFPYAPARAKRVSRPALGKGKRGFEHIRVLFVEDEDAVRRAVARGLRRSGFQLTLARDGEEARALLRTRPAAFDVVVSDLRMPGTVQGEHLAAEVGQDLPVIVVSGNPPSGGVRGATALLTKPVPLQELVGQIVEAATKRER
ncbi:MAG: ATP-binding protein [Myxococcota bacterium]